MDKLTFALAKGRLGEKAMEMLTAAGYECEEMQKKSRKLVFDNEEKKLSFFLAKASDVPTYVEYGAADIGIVGKDTLLEENKNLYEVLNLGFGKCKIVVAGKPDMASELGGNKVLKVATKYPRIAMDYFYHKKHQTVEIIKLNGSIELSPVVNLSDIIVDIVETGSTLRENGLVVLEDICTVSARLVVNRVSMKMKHERISGLIESLKAIQEGVK